MKRMSVLTLLVLTILLLNVSCQAQTPVTVMDGFHQQMNLGMVDQALVYVAEDAVFRVKAAPIAGVNGEFVGRDSIRNWLKDIAGSDGQVRIFGMDLEGDTLTCLLSYGDGFVQSVGLNDIAMEETSVVVDGMIQSYSLSWLPSAKARFNNTVAAKYTALGGIDPADRKFYLAGHITRPGSSEPWLRDVDPADRKFYFDLDCTLPSMGPEDICDRKFFDEGYITNQDG